MFFEKVRSFFGLRKGVFLDFFAVMQDFVMRTVRKKYLFLEASVCLFQNSLELFNINVNVQVFSLFLHCHNKNLNRRAMRDAAFGTEGLA